MSSVQLLIDSTEPIQALTARRFGPYGRYLPLKLLAVGGMAEIYLAEDREAERLVVVKKALREVFADASLRQMFWDEARIASAVRHPNVAQVLDTTSARDEGFYVMEFLLGVDVAALLHWESRRDSRIPLEHALVIASTAARALHAAHSARASDGSPLEIVHRDVTPSNVHLSLDGHVRLLDFGVARAAIADRSGTTVGQIKGKLAYMAPEQIQGYADRRSDIYGLGVVLYEMTTCRRLFKIRNRTFAQILKQRFDIVRPSERVSGYPAELERIVLRALATDPEHRYPDAAAFADAIDGFMRDNGLEASTEALAEYASRASLALGGGNVEKTAVSVYAEVYIAHETDPTETDPLEAAEAATPVVWPQQPVLPDVEGSIDVDFADETASFRERSTMVSGGTTVASGMNVGRGFSSVELAILAALAVAFVTMVMTMMSAAS